MLLVSLGLSLIACSKDEGPQSVPVPSSSVQQVNPTPTVAADPTVTATASAVPPPPPPVVTAPVQQASIDGCCAALTSFSQATKNKSDRDKATQAAKICNGIAALVKSGKTQRASAMASIKAQLSGIPAPAECR